MENIHSKARLALLYNIFLLVKRLYNENKLQDVDIRFIDTQTEILNSFLESFDDYDVQNMISEYEEIRSKLINIEDKNNII